MPEDYSLQEDQVNPVDLAPPAPGPAAGLNIPGLGQPAPAPDPAPIAPSPVSAAPADSNFADQFEQMIMRQLQENTPEAIKKKKMEEYLQNLGIKGNPDSFKNRLIRGLSEGSTALQAQKAGKPYQPLNTRLADSAQAEYEKSYPLIRSQAETLAKDIRERQKGANAANTQILRNQSTDLRTGVMRQKNEIQADINKSLAGDKDAHARLLNDQAMMIEKGAQQFGGLVGLPPGAKEALAPFLIQSQLGEMAPQYLRALQAQKLAAGADKFNPSTVAALPEPERRATLDTQAEIEANKKLGKFPPTGGLGQVVTTEGEDASGNMTKEYGLLNKATQQISAVGGPRPFDQKKYDIDKTFSQSLNQTKGAFSDLVAAVQKNKAVNFTGPGEGNPISKYLRVLGVNGDKLTPEALRDVLSKNATLLHTKAMAGGSRYAMQMAHDMEQSLATNGAASADSQLYGLGALHYSVEMGKLDNLGKLGDDDVSNTLMTRIQNEIQRAVKTAKADQIWNSTPAGKAHPRETRISLRPLKEIIKEDREQVGLPESKPLTGSARDEAVNNFLK